MSSQSYWPLLEDVEEVFAAELQAAGGSVLSCHRLADKLFARGVLNLADDVTYGDTINSGVALRVVKDQISVHPFTYRQVCTNGAIAANSVGSCRLLRLEADSTTVTPFDVSQCVGEIRQAIRVCSDPSRFREQIEVMCELRNVAMDQLISVSSMLRDLGSERLIRAVMDQFLQREEPTAYGLMNAVTAVARDAEPESRWNLEAYGCGIGAKLLPQFHALAGSS